MRLSDFKALSFDCYGTLIDWEAGLSEALRPLAERAGKSPEELLEAYGPIEHDLEEIHADKFASGYMLDVIWFAKGRALERLGEFELAALHYERVAELTTPLAQAAQRGRSVCTQLAAERGVREPLREQQRAGLPHFAARSQVPPGVVLRRGDRREGDHHDTEEREHHLLFRHSRPACRAAERPGGGEATGHRWSATIAGV